MGEIADMMLEGELCEGCGVYIGRGAQGYPGYCSRACAQDRGAAPPKQHRIKIRCLKCGKSFSSQYALSAHSTAKHPEGAQDEL